MYCMITIHQLILNQQEIDTAWLENVMDELATNNVQKAKGLILCEQITKTLHNELKKKLVSKKCNGMHIDIII